MQSFLSWSGDIVTSSPTPHFWDERYREAPEYYGNRPNDWLAHCVGSAPQDGTAICLAEGQGRNALWLAGLGMRVLAVDGSSVAMAQLRAEAKQRQVPITTRVAVLPDWTPSPQSADLVVLTYAHFPPAVRPVIHAQAAAALKPGGRLVLEAFEPAQFGRESGGPKDRDMLYSEAMLRADFAMLELQYLSLLAYELDEGPGHQGPARIVRLLAKAGD